MMCPRRSDVPNLVPQDINEWMRRIESRIADLTRRRNDLVPGIIATGVDLDGYRTSGAWYRESTTSTTTTLNYPANSVAGILRVYQAPPGDSVVQEFIHRSDGRRWTRWYNGATWTAWGAT